MTKRPTRKPAPVGPSNAPQRQTALTGPRTRSRKSPTPSSNGPLEGSHVSQDMPPPPNPSPTKKRKLDRKNERLKVLHEEIDFTLTGLNTLAEILDRRTVVMWKSKIAQISSFPERATGDEFQDLMLIEAGDNILANSAANGLLHALSQAIKQYKSPPLLSPSEFARASEWADYQAGPDPLLCGRPASARGPPLSILHCVFRQFYVDLRHANGVTITAMQIARCLSNDMPGYFGSEDGEGARKRRFGEHTNLFLGIFQDQRFVKHGRDSAFADGAQYVDEIPIAFLEVKSEPGQSGDVWLQLTRLYDIAAKDMNDRIGDSSSIQSFVEQGAPMFLISLVGQFLYIFGAFREGRRTLVELLAPPQVMGVSDHAATNREYNLAVALQALRNGLQSLKNLANEKKREPHPPPPLTPRVYTSWTFNSTIPKDTRVLFTKEFQPPRANGSQRLFFEAKLSSSPNPILVKLVPQDYGEDVHKLLAREGLAPQLYGASTPECTFKAYAMELLGDDWRTLNLLQPDPTYKLPIQNAVERVLSLLRENNMVHGDLRDCNIMVQIQGRDVLEPRVVEDGEKRRAIVKVIDFDWAGIGGRVSYPHLRNPSITWAGEPGGLIQVEHDEEMIAHLLGTLFDKGKQKQAL